MLLPWGPNCGVLLCERACAVCRKLVSEKVGCCCGKGWPWVVVRNWVLFNPALVTAYEEGSWMASKPRAVLC